MESSNAEMRRTELLRASPRMFENELLDKLSRVHPVVPILLFVPAVAVFVVLAATNDLGVFSILAWAAGGYAFWTLCEYWIHRSIFHFEPEEGFGARLHWIIHGVHHDHPNDPLRLVMPPSVSVPLASLFCSLFWVVLGTPLRYAFGAGFLAGYLIYDMTHYHLHHHKPQHARRAGGCASSTCATTSRTTRAASASAPRTGTRSFRHLPEARLED